MLDKKLKISQLEIFIQVVDSMNYSRAAEILGVSRAYISQAILSLEKSVGVELFSRTTRLTGLTYEGQLLLNQCRKLRRELDNTSDLVTSFQSELKGKLRISCNSFLAENVLLPLLTLYKQKFPKVEVDVIIEERLPNFYKEQIDIVFGVNWQAPQDIVAKKIAKTKYVLCATPKYIEQKNYIPKKISDLKHLDFIPHLSRSSALVGLKESSSLCEVASEIYSNNINFIKKCVMHSLGVALFHDYMVKEELLNGQLIELLPSEFNDSEDLFMYYQKNVFVQPKVREFVKIAVENINLSSFSK